MLRFHVERLLGARSPTDIRSELFHAMSGYGYPYGVYIATLHAGLPPTVIRQPPLCLGNLPAAVTGAMGERFDAASLPWIDWARRNRGDITLARLTAEALDQPSATAAFEIARRFGLEASRIISLSGLVERAEGLILLCPTPDTGSEREEVLWLKGQRDLWVICHIAHLQMANLANKNTRSILTERQREVLEWTSAGKTVSEVAIILGLTPATVENICGWRVTR